MSGDEHDCGVDWITCSSTAKKNTGLATQRLIDRTQIHQAKKPGKFGLASLWIVPHLRDDDGARLQLNTVLLSNPQPGAPASSNKALNWNAF